MNAADWPRDWKYLVAVRVPYRMLGWRCCGTWLIKTGLVGSLPRALVSAQVLVMTGAGRWQT